MTIAAAARTPVETESSATGSDRRIHARLSPEELNIPASIRIQNHPPVSLVDLSPGGARIDLPFQIRPDARMTVELRSASERMMLPFRFLRCYVTSLKGGVVYQAAGVFEQGFNWKPLLEPSADTRATCSRLIATLEAFLRQGSMSGREIEFNQLLVWIREAARRGERAERIGAEIRLRLESWLPTIVVEPPSKPFLPDPAKGARFFGIDFKSEHVLSAPDRRLLRTTAQLLSIVNRSTQGEGGLGAARLLDFNPARTRSLR